MIYLAKVDDFNEEFFAVSLASLPLNLAQKVDKILNSKAKKESILAWSILKSVLNSEYSIENFEIGYSKNSKPFLKNEDLFFNISHSENYVICAFANKEIGIDIQKIVEYKPRVAQRMFTQVETELIEKTENKNELFTKLWTMKESYLKFTGEGIASSAKNLDFSNFLQSESFEVKKLKFKTFTIEDYFISVCSEDCDFELKFVGKIKD